MSTTDVLHQYSDNMFFSTIEGLDGGPTSNTDYSDVEYLISDRSGNVKLKLTLGQGITRDGPSDFLIHIDDAAIPFMGAHEHQLVVWDLDGNKLPPVFKRRLNILPILKEFN